MRQLLNNNKKILTIITCIIFIISFVVIGNSSKFIEALNNQVSANPTSTSQTPFDDGPLGEKIVDFDCSTQGLCYALTENKEIYSWQDKVNNEFLVNSNKTHEVYAPRKIKVPLESGSKDIYLQNVEKVWLTSFFDYYKPNMLIRTTDKKLYLYGNMEPTSNYKQYTIFEPFTKSSGDNIDLPVEVKLKNGISSELLDEIYMGFPDSILIKLTDGRFFGLGGDSYDELPIKGGKTNQIKTLTELHDLYKLPEITNIYNNNAYGFYYLCVDGKLYSNGYGPKSSYEKESHDRPVFETSNIYVVKDAENRPIENVQAVYSSQVGNGYGPRYTFIITGNEIYIKGFVGSRNYTQTISLSSLIKKNKQEAKTTKSLEKFRDTIRNAVPIMNSGKDSNSALIYKNDKTIYNLIIGTDKSDYDSLKYGFYTSYNEVSSYSDDMLLVRDLKESLINRCEISKSENECLPSEYDLSQIKEIQHYYSPRDKNKFHYYVLTEKGALFTFHANEINGKNVPLKFKDIKESNYTLNGKRIPFGQFIVKGEKTKDQSVYKSDEKYNEDINLITQKLVGEKVDIVYKIDGLNEENSINEEGLLVEAKENVPIQNNYHFYIRNLEKNTKTDFKVDLYKKEMSISNLQNGESYSVGKRIDLGDNGFQTAGGIGENIVTAQYKLNGSSSFQTYSSNTPLTNPGDYEFVATDEYGNTGTFNFTITDGPTAGKMIFTPNNPLIYNTTHTREGGTLGTVSLQTQSGENIPIKSLTISSGEGQSYFRTEGSNIVANRDKVPAGEYSLNIQATYGNSKTITGIATFEVVKAEQTMKWTDKAREFEKTGITVGQEGVVISVDTIAESAEVSYTVSPNDNGISINSSTGVLTINSLPSSGKIIVTAVAKETDNYKDKTIQIEIDVKKLAYLLEVQIQDPADQVFKNEVSIKVGSAKPTTFKIVATEKNQDVKGKEKSFTATYQFKQGGRVVKNPQNQVGTYVVEGSVEGLDNYDIEWKHGILNVQAETVDNTWYTLTTKDTQKTYIPGEWTKEDIIITPKHEIFNELQIENGNFQQEAQTYTTEGDHNVTLTFKNESGVTVKTTINIKIDKTAPTVNAFSYDKVGLNFFQRLLRAITFNHTLFGEHTITISAKDVNGDIAQSGVKNIKYKIQEITEDGANSGSEAQEQTANNASVKDSLHVKKIYRITAKAEDNVGNVSAEKTETVRVEEEEVVPEPEIPETPKPPTPKPPEKPDPEKPVGPKPPEPGGDGNEGGGQKPNPPQPPNPGGGEGGGETKPPVPPTPPQPPKPDPDQGGNEEIKPPKPNNPNCVVGPDGKPGTEDDVCGTGSGNATPQPKPDGSVVIPPKGDGGATFPGGTVVPLPDGGTINPDGTITIPNGGNKPDRNDCVPGPDGILGTADDVCGIAPPNQDVDKKPDGSIVVPPDGVIVFPDKVIPVPDGAIIHPDGSVTLPDGTELDPNGNKKPGKVCPNDGTDINVDTNGDGKPDLNIDTNGDCKPDVNIDSNGDKKPDINVDTNGDGKPDVNIDSDGDGNPDVNVDIDCDGDADINIDTDGDGIPNINIDTTGDGKPNYNVDLDGDKIPDLNIGPVKWKTDKCGITECGTKYCTSTFYDPYLNIDTDNDMRPDVNVDLDKDKVADINIDINKDYIPDINIDTTGDGAPDINVDVDGDGRPDKNLAIVDKWVPDKDVDGNIKYDTMSGLVPDSNVTPENWRPSGGGGNNNFNGGASTGQYGWSIWWILLIISGSIVTYGICRKKKEEEDSFSE